MAGARFKLNQYNWLGQKFLVQHRYDDVLKICNHSTRLRSVAIEFESHTRDAATCLGSSGQLSDHLSYLGGLALIKTSTRLDELIFTLQRLNFQKNGQYFLLLCQCLLYLGEHDAVVALFKQTLNKEIDTTSFEASSSPSSGEHGASREQQSTSGDEQEPKLEGARKRLDWCLGSISCDETVEFRRIFESVSQSRLVSDPRLWFLLAQSLELQLLFRDAELAYKMAAKLASGQARRLNPSSKSPESRRDSVILIDGDSPDDGPPDRLESAAMSNFQLPHLRHAEFAIKRRADFKAAVQTLCQASSVAPLSHSLGLPLALALCCQPNANASHFSRALELLDSLDALAVSVQNPAAGYNQLALKCKQRLAAATGSGQLRPDQYDDLQTVGPRNELNNVLMKSHIKLNNLLQSSERARSMYSRCPLRTKSNKEECEPDLDAKLEQLAEMLRNCDATSWASSSGLWNNLGLCYLLKGRLVASLSCLLRSHQISPLDWRLNYNLALVFLQVDLAHRALGCLLTARSSYRSSSHSFQGQVPSQQVEAQISALLAACYSELGLPDESRRLYAEMGAQWRRSVGPRTLTLALVNYLLLLRNQSSADGDRELDARLMGRLLDQLEQAWLQRNQNETQHNVQLLEVAKLIGEELSQQVGERMRKTYAWTKAAASASIVAE